MRSLVEALSLEPDVLAALMDEGDDSTVQRLAVTDGTEIYNGLSQSWSPGVLGNM
jgi:hypothetical protein